MRSTSGRSTCLFVVEDSEPLAVRLEYSWSVFPSDSSDPDRHEVVLPSMSVRRDRLVAFAAQAERYGNAMGRSPGAPRTVSVDLAGSPGDTLRIELRPTDDGLIASAWQAVFVVSVSCGPSFDFRGRFVIDATCLDLFSSELAAAMRNAESG